MQRTAATALPWHAAISQLFRPQALFLQALLVLALWLAATAALAQEDPPGRVGRLADFNGSVSWWDSETGEWAAAERNRPLTGGDRISTATSGRAEVRVGSTVLRLSNNTEVEVLRLDDTHMVFQLHSGSMALRVRSREIADEVELVTEEARMLPRRAGHYRIDRVDDTTQATAWRGELRVDEANGLVVGAGQRAELYREGRRGAPGALRTVWIDLPRDGFTEWVTSEDRRDERTASTRYVSPEMTGAEELDRHGRWEQHPEFGAIWLPQAVAADWAPYRYGRWAWVSPWGWTWVDEAPWGFAPFHYGRWVSWSGRWGWVPGAYVPRPVYAPALVAWVGGGNWGVSIGIGGPTVGWLPLAPREVYRPHYRVSPVYVERVNPAPPYRWQHAPGQVPTGPISYGNQGVPNAVTVVPRDVLVRRQPVARGMLESPQTAPRQPLAQLPAPAAPEPRPGRGWQGRDGRDGRDIRDDGREGRDNRDGRDGFARDAPGRERPGRPAPAAVVAPTMPQSPAAAPPVVVQPPVFAPGRPEGRGDPRNDGRVDPRAEPRVETGERVRGRDDDRNPRREARPEPPQEERRAAPVVRVSPRMEAPVAAPRPAAAPAPSPAPAAAPVPAPASPRSAPPPPAAQPAPRPAPAAAPPVERSSVPERGVSRDGERDRGNR